MVERARCMRNEKEKRQQYAEQLCVCVNKFVFV